MIAAATAEVALAHLQTSMAGLREAAQRLQQVGPNTVAMPPGYWLALPWIWGTYLAATQALKASFGRHFGLS